MQINSEKMKKFYDELTLRMDQVRAHIRKPLTLAEKILFSHAVNLQNFHKQSFEDSTSTIEYFPDHVAVDDITAQIALLQFPLSGQKSSAVPFSVHCEHMVVAENGVEQDIARAYEENREIVNFLQSASEKYGLGFWKPGSGIIHHQLFDHYAFPGGMVVISDSYASYVGGLGMLAIEGNGVDILDLMTGNTCAIALPKFFGVRLTGKLQGWASAKDLALCLVKLFTASGAKGAVIEYFGDGTETISSSGKAVICSMGKEAGALSSIFPYDKRMEEYLMSTGRNDVAKLADKIKEHLQADSDVLANPETYYDHYIELDLSSIVPQIAGPFSSDKACSLSELSELAFHYGYPEKLSLALIGFTNSSFEDIVKAAFIAKQALKHGLKTKIPLFISPGSERIKFKLMEAGLWQVLIDIGAKELAASRGPCEGYWKRNDIPFGEKNSILTSYNRASLGAYDGNPGTHTFIASPEIVMALALAGSLNFNPAEDALLSPQGLPVRFATPSVSTQPLTESTQVINGYHYPIADSSAVQIAFDPDSERLQAMESFKPPFEKLFTDLRPLIKVSGRCSISQIFPEGKWLKYRGHLSNFSNNLFTLAPNEFRDEIGRGKNLLSGAIEAFAKVAKDYKKEDLGWVVIAHEGFGEGQHSDHAALSIRFLGGKAVIAQSFDPIHEITLKKQGVLALTFAWPENGDKIREDDLIDLLGVNELAVDQPLELLLKHANGTTERLKLNHSYTEDHIAWFKAGSYTGHISNVV